MRTGTITFTVLAGEDHAHGDVLMVPDGASGMSRRYPPYEPPPPAWAVEHLPQTIAFWLVRLDGRVVSGSTEQYWDPGPRVPSASGL